MKMNRRLKRHFPSFPQFVQKKWKTLETGETSMVKTLENQTSDVEIFESFTVRTHVRKRRIPVFEVIRERLLRPFPDKRLTSLNIF